MQEVGGSVCVVNQHIVGRVSVLTDGDGNSRVITKEEAKEYSVLSYWKEGDKPAIMNVTRENVLMVK